MAPSPCARAGAAAPRATAITKSTTPKTSWRIVPLFIDEDKDRQHTPSSRTCQRASVCGCALAPPQSCGTAGQNDGRTRISDDTIANVSAKALPWESVEEGD